MSDIFISLRDKYFGPEGETLTLLEFKLLTLLMSLIRKNRMKHKKTSQINKIKVQF